MGQTVIYKREETQFDVEGNFYAIKTKEVSKMQTEPNFVKLYLDHVCLLNDIPKAMNNILMEFLKDLTYAENGHVITADKFQKEIISRRLGVSISRINASIQQFKKKDLMKRIGHARYMINPEIFGKGGWKDLVKVKEFYVNLETRKIQRIKK